ncbi:hypothetical protein B0H11DRAFT_415136 [Mycena galericulata]|nr:hypothetical protein B0H11DRAFT_415136 [Mycena galericulata]
MQNVTLEPRAGSARSQAVAARHLQPGSLIVSCEALSTVLVPEAKGQRCDTCHRIPPQLQKCTGCASYFYCSAACQARQWQAHHKKICKRFNRYAASVEVQALPAHEKMDALLLSHLVAQLDIEGAGGGEALASVIDLLPGPVESRVPPLVYASSSPRLAPPQVRALHARFGNNNFVVHSHLTTVAHGVFPRASRLFNHACLPNAAAKYIFTPAEAPRMEVVALRDIAPGEEICLPYLDPALLQTRQQIFQLSYGFECRCASCLFFENVGPIPIPPADPAQREDLARRLLREFEATPHDGLTLTRTKTTADGYSFPSELLPVFHESFITYLAETFRNAAHDGVYPIARASGAALLALYRLIYPPNYPQIGMHLLELAKTSWNSIVLQEDADATGEAAKRKEASAYLSDAKAVLAILGPEGDPDGPLVEIGTLEQLLREG